MATMSAATIDIDAVSFRYPNAQDDTLSGVSLTVEPGEFLVLVGESGCGKSTLLRLLAGLEQPSDGTLRFDGRPVNGLAPKARDVAMVFQSYALYPHLTVGQNIGFPLRIDGLSRDARRQRVAEVAELLNLTELLTRKPGMLSGGQRQRVAMGRAMVRSPKLLLFDEPLSNLDANLRRAMRAELAARHRSMGITTVYVTHDQVEAMTLGDRIALLRNGQLEQVGTPNECFEQPQTAYAAAFFGSPPAALLPAKVAGDLLHLGTATLPWGRPELGPDLTVGLRPNALQPAPDGAFDLAVSEVEYTGADVLVHGHLAGLNESVVMTCSAAAAACAQPGQTLRVSIDVEALLLFDRSQGRALP
jgi:multiple sugar transport system ATP-binding protein